MKNEHAENYILLASVIAAAALVALVFLPELNAIVLGITFAVLFQPLYGWLVKRFPRGGSAAALLVVLLTVLVIFIPLAFIGLQMFNEATGLYATISSGGSFPAVHYLETKLNTINPSLGIDLNGYLQQFFGWAAGNLGSLFSGIAAALFAMLLSFFVLYYFLRDGNRLHEAILRLSPLSAEDTSGLVAKLHLIMSSIVRGTLLMAAFYGLAGGIGFFMFGLPSAAFWGAVTAFASFIPVFGAYLVVIPGMVALSLGGHYLAAAGLFVWIGAVGLFFENYLRPRLIGRKTNIHPLLVIFSVVGGLSFFGPLGILLGPLALGVLLALLEVYPVLTKKA
ncbi:MAG: AI-2E family transporter [Candidatus Pacebacteria bacterium]|nr:AI-2E family transporter [Candidatus Paceibacterota bacterium]